MKKPMTVVLGLSTSMSSETLGPLRKMDFLDDAELHFVHVVEEAHDLRMSINSKHRTEQSEAVTEKMRQIAHEIRPLGSQREETFKCLFDFDPAQAFVNYLREVAADLALLSHRKTALPLNEGFIEDVRRSAPCSVMVMPEQKIRGTSSTVAVGVGPEERGKLCRELAQFPWLKRADLQLIHLRPAGEFGVYEDLLVNPFPEAEMDILAEQHGVRYLETIKRDLRRLGFIGRIDLFCQTSSQIKKDFSRLMAQGHYRFAIIFDGTKERYLGGFIRYQLRHLYTPVLVFKPGEPKLSAAKDSSTTKNLQPGPSL